MTSGTSGKPKCILCPFVAFATAVRAREAALEAMGLGYALGDVEACNVMFVWEAARPLCFGRAMAAVLTLTLTLTLTLILTLTLTLTVTLTRYPTVSSLTRHCCLLSLGGGAWRAC